MEIDNIVRETISEETFALLNKWAEEDAGKEYPACNEPERTDWLNFVVAAFREGVEHRAVVNELAAWLVERKGWNPQQADEMATRYERAIDVLAAYKRTEA